MENDALIPVDEVAGNLHAEMLRGLLEAQGISAILSEESAALVYGVTLPAMGTVQILVRADQAEAARQILDDYYAGNLEETDIPAEENADPDGTEAADA